MGDVDVEKLFQSIENAASPMLKQAMNQAKQAQGSPGAARAKQNAQQAQNQAKAIFNQNKNKNLGDLYKMLQGAVAGQLEKIDNEQLRNLAKEAGKAVDMQIKQQAGGKGNLKVGQFVQNGQKQIMNMMKKNGVPMNQKQLNQKINSQLNNIDRNM